MICSICASPKAPRACLLPRIEDSVPTCAPSASILPRAASITARRSRISVAVAPSDCVTRSVWPDRAALRLAFCAAIASVSAFSAAAMRLPSATSCAAMRPTLRLLRPI